MKKIWTLTFMVGISISSIRCGFDKKNDRLDRPFGESVSQKEIQRGTISLTMPVLQERIDTFEVVIESDQNVPGSKFEKTMRYPYQANSIVELKDIPVGPKRINVHYLFENQILKSGEAKVEILENQKVKATVYMGKTHSNKNGSVDIKIIDKDSKPPLQPIACGLGGPEMCKVVDGKIVSRVNSLSTCETDELRKEGYVLCSSIGPEDGAPVPVQPITPLPPADPMPPIPVQPITPLPPVAPTPPVVPTPPKTPTETLQVIDAGIIAGPINSLKMVAIAFNKEFQYDQITVPNGGEGLFIQCSSGSDDELHNVIIDGISVSGDRKSFGARSIFPAACDDSGIVKVLLKSGSQYFKSRDNGEGLDGNRDGSPGPDAIVNIR